eukprot:gene7545-6462_t
MGDPFAAATASAEADREERRRKKLERRQFKAAVAEQVVAAEKPFQVPAKFLASGGAELGPGSGVAVDMAPEERPGRADVVPKE